MNFRLRLEPTPDPRRRLRFLQRGERCGDRPCRRWAMAKVPPRTSGSGWFDREAFHPPELERAEQLVRGLPGHTRRTDWRAAPTALPGNLPANSPWAAASG